MSGYFVPKGLVIRILANGVGFPSFSCCAFGIERDLREEKRAVAEALKVLALEGKESEIIQGLMQGRARAKRPIS